MALEVQTQADFSAGAFPGMEDIPPNGVEDIENGMLRDDGAIERRGGVSYMSGITPGAVNIDMVWDGFLAAGPRTILRSGDKLYRLNPSDDTTVELVADFPVLMDPAPGQTIAITWYGRPRVYGGVLLLAAKVRSTYMSSVETFITMFAYAGGTPHSRPTLSGMAITQGSRTLTVASTTDMQPGDLIEVGPTSGPGTTLLVVQSVDSSTQVTLVDPYPFATIMASGPDSAAARPVFVVSEAGDTRNNQGYLAAAGSRVFLAQGRRIDMSGFVVDGSGNSRPVLYLDPTDYHLLPEGAVALGAEPLNGTVVIFSSEGVFQVTHPELDLTDDQGNAQQALVQVNRDILLWGDPGLATWQNTLLVPATDDLYLFTTSADAPQNQVRAITGGARKRYRDHVRAGRRLGAAQVYQGHYFLPILDDNGAAVEQMVWRIDTLGGAGAPYVGKWTGQISASRSYAVRSTDPGRNPRLFAAVGTRVLDCAPAFTLANASDADGTAHQLKVTTRSYMVSETQQHTLRKGRIRYELVDPASSNPTITAEYATGAPGSSFTTVTGAAPEGDQTYTWVLAKKSQRTRFRFTSNNSAASCVLRAIEAHVRPTGRA